MNMETYTVVHFQRELGSREDDHPKGGRFEPLGEMPMGDVPAVGENVFINGVAYRVTQRQWSVCPVLPGQPNFTDPQALLTVVLIYNEGELKDFRS